MPHRKLGVTLFNSFVLLIACAALLFSLLGFAGALSTQLDLLAHFRLHALVGSGVLLLLVLLITGLCKRRRLLSASLVILLVSILSHAYALHPLWVGGPAHVFSNETSTLRLIQFNLDIDNRDFDSVVDYLKSNPADLVVLQEYSFHWNEIFQSAWDVVCAAGYEPIFQSWEEGVFGQLILVNTDTALSDLRVRAVEDDWPLRVEVLGKFSGREIAVTTIHPPPPVYHEMAIKNRQALADVANWCRRQSDLDRPSIIIGDFNATPMSYAFRELEQNAGMIDSSKGFGWQGTYPAQLAWTGMLPIDHCVHSPDWVTVERKVGPDIGSDHMPLYIELALLP